MSNIFSLILIIASLGLFFGFIDPTYSDIKELNVKKVELDHTLENSRLLQQERDKFLDQSSKMNENDRGRLFTLLPDNIDNVRLLIDLDEMAQTFDMHIRNFKADTTSEETGVIGGNKKPYETLTISFSTTASYSTFLAFLRDIERSLRVLDITDIKFSSSGNNQLYDYNVTLKTYWLK